MVDAAQSSVFVADVELLFGSGTLAAVEARMTERREKRKRRAEDSGTAVEEKKAKTVEESSAVTDLLANRPGLSLRSPVMNVDDDDQVQEPEEEEEEVEDEDEMDEEYVQGE
jgi:hypothetical protein